MAQKGFTLLELLAIMLIMAALLSIGSLYFSEMNRKAGIESQVRVMHADLINVRAQSLCQQKGKAIKITGGNTFSVYSSVYPPNPPSGSPVLTKVLKFPVNIVTSDSSGNIVGTTTEIDLDGNGLVPGLFSDTSNGTLANGSIAICVAQGGGPASIDSIVISATQIRMGKNSGGNCAHIAVK